MTVTSTSTSVTWAGNGSTTEFSYSFLIPAPGQYALYSTTAGVTTLVAQNLYSVAGIGFQGGTVVYPLTGSPIASGTTLTFVRVVPYQQTFHPPPQGPIYNPLLEGALDNLQMQIIQVEQQLGDTMINGVTVDNLTFDGAVSVAFTGSELPGVGETTATITLPPGPQGPIGLTPNISVAANALPVGQSATATLSGTSLDPTITFGLPTGATGQRGSIWYDGAGAPGTIAGALAGDQYLDTNTGNVYQYASGAWTKTTDIMGPQGAQGVQGAQGIPGVGSSILVANNGTVFPTAALELNFTGGTLSESGSTVTIPLGYGGIEYDSSSYTTIAAGSGVTITPGGETLTFSASGGGGNSPYTVPLLSQFTAINTPSGATASDTSTGLACHTPTSGRSLLMLADNTAPGITFTITAGFNDQAYGADAASAIFVRDAAGKSLIFSTNASSSSYFGGLVSEWSNNTTYAGVNLSQKTSNKQVNFLCVVYNGTTLSFYAGNDLNGLSLIYSASATAYLTAISSVGICQQGNSGPINTTFFHYTHTP